MIQYARLPLAVLLAAAALAVMTDVGAGQDGVGPDYYWSGTPTPSAPATPAAAGRRSSLERGYPQVCAGLEQLFVPRAAVESALEDPMEVAGWNAPANPNRPVSWTNPRRRLLTLHAPSKPFHPLYNTLVFKASCPHR